MNLIVQIRRFFSFSHLVFLIAFVSLYFVQFDGFANDPGVGWHLDSGKWMVEHRAIPKNDPFLSSLTPRPWISDQWLSDLIIYNLFQWGSWPILYNFIGTIFVLTFFILVLPAVSSLSGSYIAAAYATFFTFKIAQIHFILRPVVFPFLYFAITFYSLLCWYRGKSNKTPWYLILVMLLWTNLHPSFVIGLFLMALFVLAKFIDAFVDANSNTLSCKSVWPKIKIPFYLFLLASLVTLINPYGIELHKSVLSLGESKFFMNLNEEWTSPNFDELSGTIFGSILLYIILGLFLGGKPKWRAFEPLVLIIFTWFSLKAVRFFPYFGIVASLCMAESLMVLGRNKIFEKYTSFLVVKKAFMNIELKEGYSKRFVLVILGVIFIWGTINHRIFAFNEELGPRSNKYPFAALAWLNQNTPQDRSVTVLSVPNWGGFITHYGSGKIKAIVDDRNTLLGEDFYKQYFNAFKIGGNWREFAAQFNAEYLLLPRQNTLMCDIKETGFELVQQDEISILVKLKI